MIPVTRKYVATNTPQGLKRPGLITVCPRKAPANAGSRYGGPPPGSAAPTTPACMIPAIVQMRAVEMRARARIESTRSPASRATSRPSPTNSRCRPSGV